ncbi:DUF4254 domain-containing protein [Nocardia vulneris]|uniref:DUF4254 domain-containing protein n=1 Tax=Nocardia vulneris TaxID=1141657 RepID=UPI0005BB5CE5|nr:DUF4254 domain-containing protein [Nocardia vulneris]
MTAHLADPAQIPGRELLLMACRGMPLITAHPILDAAAELAQIHAELETTATPDERLSWHRIQLVASIDTWVRDTVPPAFPAAPLHTETLGQVVDRLAQLTHHTFVALAYASDALYGDAWARLLDLASGYQNLIDELHNGTRRLPATFLGPW